jgi:membrane-bound inhibitor of C-type lysozyme
MKKILFSLLVALVLAGCGDSSDNMIKCGAYEVETEAVDQDNLRVVLNGDEVVLTRAVSASGARYEGVLNDITIALWNKGNDWTLFLNGEDPVECDR